MGIFLTLAYLFFIGSVLGWIVEVLFRNLVHHNKKWINPGSCTGPYLPIYGCGLCLLYLLASLEQYHFIADPFWNRLVLLLAMAVGMTLIEYIAGVCSLKIFKVRLWDYSKKWGNIQGIICPQFSLLWAVLGVVYYFLIHPYILDGLEWLSQNLAFSFFIGMFFGVFLIDVIHSGNLLVKLKQFAEENGVIVRYEALKQQIRASYERSKAKYHFFRPFRTEKPLGEYLREMQQAQGKSKKRLRKKGKCRQSARL